MTSWMVELEAGAWKLWSTVPSSKRRAMSVRFTLLMLVKLPLTSNRPS